MSFEKTTVGAFARIQGGYAYKSSDFLDEGACPVLKIKNIRAGHVDYDSVSYVADHVAEATRKWQTEPGDILISMTGSGPSAPDSLVGRVAKVWRTDPKALINQRVGRVCLKDSVRIDLDFLFYLLSWAETQQYLVSNATGSANQVNISGTTIESVECPNIDYETSKAISSLLGALDERVRLLRETNATLEAIAQALFKSWFIDFDPVRTKAEGLQPEGMDDTTAALFPDSFEESELGLVPKGWRSGKFTDVIVESGVRVGTSESVVLSAVQTGHLVRSYDHFNKKVHSSDIRKYKRVAPLSFAYNPSRINIGSIGINEQGCLGAVSPIYVVFSPLDEPTGFLIWHHLRTERVRSLVRSLASGTVRQSVSFSDFASIPLVVPDQSVLDQFSLIRAAVYKKIETNKNQAQTLTQLRDTLLPRLISGQLRLPDAEQAVEEALA